MSTDQPPQEQEDNASPRTGWGVGMIGVLLVIVLLCGLLLRGMTDRQPAISTDSNLTSVQPETARIDGHGGSEIDQQPDTTTPTQQTPRDAPQYTPSTTPPDDSTSGSAVDNAPSAMDSPPVDDAAATAETALGTSLATLKPMEIDGVQSGPEGPWQPASFSGRRYERALCMAPSSGESTSQISFSLGGNFEQLNGIAGLQDGQDEDQSNESDPPEAIFRIYGDANLLWDSAPRTVAGATEPFQLDVQGLDYLTLVVEYGLRADGAQPAWADLQLVPTASDDMTPNSSVGEP